MAIINGTAGADDLSGTAENDSINGLDGNDRLVGMEGDDVIDGGTGDDQLHGSWGADTLIGGDGIDIIAYLNSSTAVTVNLGSGATDGEYAAGDTWSGVEGVSGSQLNDALWGDAAANTLLGIEGDDLLIGMEGDDVIDGGAGNDEMHGSWGADSLNGGDGIDLIAYLNSDAGVTVNLATGEAAGGYAAGDTWTGVEGVSGSQLNDTLTGDAAANTLIGLEGGDVLVGGGGADSLDGSAGTDTAKYNTSSAAVTVDLTAGTGLGGDAQGDTLANFENLGGSAFNDTLTGDAGVNLIGGGGGDDTLAGAAGNDTLLGGNGTDGLDGGDGWDTLEGEAGDDQLTGGAGGDTLRGGLGADHLTGGTDFDVASYWDSAVGVTINLATNVNTGGTAQGDTIADDVETINGSNHNDVMTGNGLANALLGFDGDDTLSGGGGADALRGGTGADTLNGGAGNDFFSYTAVSDSTAAAADTIQDFQAGTDLISVRTIDADGNAANGDTAFSFIGTAAFSGTAGQLRYEVGDGTTTVSADVNGDSTADIVIHLTGAITLQASDFLL